MCSVFGYVARDYTRPNLNTISRIIAANVGRGPHAFGFAWIEPDGRLRMYKQTGRLTDHLGALAMARNALMLVGHLRWATHGDPRENINNHPHPSDGGWIVHNGVVHNHDQLCRANRLHPVSECDSEVLALLIEQSGKSLLSRTRKAVAATDGNLAMLGLWSRPNSLVIARRGNPLHCAEGDEGLYIGTLESGLPGRAKSFRDETVRTYTFDSKGRRHVKVFEIPAEQNRHVSSDRRRVSLFGGSGADDETAYRGG